ncbi:hypothetical protein E4099_19840 [Streptomyces palmae]|uniref:Uncharacterized protein n=2 Tax=Streptomyces palmae TaxID=1701085 RepID=A0A4Z0GZT0_9ACTN|nr:hypothetical protein E4099_19840 [Streptomyces palmae]
MVRNDRQSRGLAMAAALTCSNKLAKRATRDTLQAGPLTALEVNAGEAVGCLAVWNASEGVPDLAGGFMASEVTMIILGVILLVVGFVTGIAILWTIGIILAAIGLILWVLGAVGHAVGGRRHYW